VLATLLGEGSIGAGAAGAAEAEASRARRAAIAARELASVLEGVGAALAAAESGIAGTTGRLESWSGEAAGVARVTLRTLAGEHARAGRVAGDGALALRSYAASMEAVAGMYATAAQRGVELAACERGVEEARASLAATADEPAPLARFGITPVAEAADALAGLLARRDEAEAALSGALRSARTTEAAAEADLVRVLGAIEDAAGSSGALVDLVPDARLAATTLVALVEAATPASGHRLAAIEAAASRLYQQSPDLGAFPAALAAAWVRDVAAVERAASDDEAAWLFSYALATNEGGTDPGEEDEALGLVGVVEGGDPLEAGLGAYNPVLPAGDGYGERVPLVPGGGLRAHEDQGGHTLERHISEGIEADLARAEQRFAGRNPPSRASYYTDRAVAEAATDLAIAANTPEVEAWLADPQRTVDDETLHLYCRLPGYVGYSFARNDPTPVVTDKVTVVLRWKPDSSLGYYILTSFPDPEAEL